MSPNEWLAGARSVISYFLPFSEEVRKSNYNEGYPSTEWLYGRVEGQTCNEVLSKLIEKIIIEAGEEALVPAIDLRFEVVDLRSNWSERHAAFIAGLGTFSLSKSMITKKGCAGRFGSIVTSLKLTPTVRSYSDIYEHCIFCGACIPRCPVGAITMEGKNHSVCRQHVYGDVAVKFSPRYGCGKCQTDVPCEYCIP